MLLFEAKRIIYKGESETVEFKHKVAFPEKVVREVVAFANTQGGHLFIGVDDNGVLVGLKHVVDEDFILQKAIRELCTPPVHFEAEVIPLTDKKSLLHYYVPSGTAKPYFAKEKPDDRYGKAYVRVGDRSVQASRELRKILKFQNNPTDVRFEYGENVRMLFRCLAESDHITLHQLRERTGLSYEQASELLVLMVNSNALRIIPREGEDWYIAAS